MNYRPKLVVGMNFCGPIAEGKTVLMVCSPFSVDEKVCRGGDGGLVVLHRTIVVPQLNVFLQQHKIANVRPNPYK